MTLHDESGGLITSSCSYSFVRHCLMKGGDVLIKFDPLLLHAAIRPFMMKGGGFNQMLLVLRFGAPGLMLSYGTAG